MTHAEMLFLALCLDAAVGDPAPLWSRIPHPVALMGRAIAAGEARLNRGARRRLKGVLLVAMLALVAIGIGAGLAATRWGPAFEILGATLLLAQRSLSDHVEAVARALLGPGLEDGRQAVSRIVGRDTTELGEPGIVRAALESAAENFSDGLVAPAFWFLVAGLPGILLYKLVNTADSMIGHRSPRYLEFGWAAARLDDLLNLVPARLAGLLIVLTGGGLRAWRVMRAEAPHHASPNAGWPEAALSGALDVALAGPRSYEGRTVEARWMNPDGRRDPDAAEIGRGMGRIWRAWGLLTGLVVLIVIVDKARLL